MSSSPAYSILADPIRHALWDLGWEELRPIQHQAIHLILQTDQDLIISARTASGKTEAAFLPILSDISTHPLGSVRALYVGPLRALINDQFRRLETLCQRAEIPVHRWHGDVSQQQKKNLLKKPGGVLLITPESLEALFTRRSQALRSLFHSLSYVVVDELHAMEGTERGTHLRSLLSRLERYCVSQPRLVALSATLGNSQQSAKWLRSEQFDRVTIITDDDDQKSIQYGIFTYMKKAKKERQSDISAGHHPSDPPPNAMACDLYDACQLETNLVFANSKADVEWFADELNQIATRDGRPGQFLVHHGALSKEIREHTERLMQGHEPYTTVCTSSLELGIDIGNVHAVGQIGCPWSVASLVQRLGRSGRRDEEPQIMRLYLLEEEPTSETHLCNHLRPHLLQAIALTELMLEKWVEPPANASGDLSTLVQQILSSITETGGMSPIDLFERLVTRGAFRSLTKQNFIDVLRSIGQHDLIEQTPEGDLILGLKGEEIVNHYDFFSAFATPPEFCVSHQGQPLGMLPSLYLPNVDDHLLLAGRRWQVVGIDYDRREVAVCPARGRKAPLFSGAGGAIHDKIRRKMCDVLLGASTYAYLNETGQHLLDTARKIAQDIGLQKSQLVRLSEDTTLWFPWVGTNTLTTLALLLKRFNLEVSTRDISLEITASIKKILSVLETSRQHFPSPEVLADLHHEKQRRKYDWSLSESLQTRSVARDVIDVSSAKNAIKELF